MKHLYLTIEEFCEISKNEKIICFGVGAHLRDILSKERSMDFDIFQRAAYLVDNNKFLIEQEYKIGCINKKIYTPDKLLGERKCYIIITSSNFADEIAKELDLIECEGGYIIWDEVLNVYREDSEISKLIYENSRKRSIVPKIIHYCWFGRGKIPEKEAKCMESWSLYCPDYMIKFWNEDNFDIRCNRYVYEAYMEKKYAFVSDYVRLWAIYNYGGIYLDTDVELLKNLDAFLVHKAFSGFESRYYIPTGIMGGEKNSDYFKYLLSYYDNRHFIVNGKPDLTTNVVTITQMTKERYNLKIHNGYIDFDDGVMYPQEVFCPIDISTKAKNITRNTYSIHWFSGTWL